MVAKEATVYIRITWILSMPPSFGRRGTAAGCTCGGGAGRQKLYPQAVGQAMVGQVSGRRFFWRLGPRHRPAEHVIAAHWIDAATRSFNYPAKRVVSTAEAGTVERVVTEGFVGAAQERGGQRDQAAVGVGVVDKCQTVVSGPAAIVSGGQHWREVLRVALLEGRRGGAGGRKVVGAHGLDAVPPDVVGVESVLLLEVATRVVVDDQRRQGHGPVSGVDHGVLAKHGCLGDHVLFVVLVEGLLVNDLAVGDQLQEAGSKGVGGGIDQRHGHGGLPERYHMGRQPDQHEHGGRKRGKQVELEQRRVPHTQHPHVFLLDAHVVGGLAIGLRLRVR